MKLRPFIVLTVTVTALLAAVPVAPVPAAPLGTENAAGTRPRLYTYSDEQGAVTSATVYAAEKLKGAPASFRWFVNRRLAALLKSDLGSDPACDRSAVVRVNAVRTDGYGMAAIGTDRQRGCERSVAGHVELYVKRNGGWHTLYRGEDIPPCAKLVKLAFPSEVGVHACMEGDHVVDYVHS